MNLYHILNKGIEGRDLFLDSSDYVRFVHNLFTFNDSAPTIDFDRRATQNTNVGHPMSHIGEKIVQIHGWCLMRNHYHLLISELTEGGLSQFIRKLNIGYAKYFNERYSRQGHLFQGKTKKVLVEREAHFLYILHYLHLNPLDYLPEASTWRERDKGSIRSVVEALEYLKSYRWSSYLDYAGQKNFPSILTKDFFETSSGEYRSTLEEYLRDAEESSIKTLVLE